MDAIAVLKILDLLLSAAAKLGINLAKYNAMRELNGGDLSDQQRQQLVDERNQAVGAL